MSYQQGPYPGPQQYPQYSGSGSDYGMPAQRPPAPPNVIRAHYTMLAGAVISLVGGLLIFAEQNTIRTALENAVPSDSASDINNLVHATLIAVVVVAVLEAGLWVWMAYKVKAGRNWARVLSSVFFGIGVFGAAIGGVHFSASTTGTNGTTHSATTTSTVENVTGWVGLVAGLVAIVLIWQKSNAPFFRPQQFGGGYPPAPGSGFPGQPGAPYPPQYPPQQPYPPQDQQPPADPWNQTPPS